MRTAHEHKDGRNVVIFFFSNFSRATRLTIARKKFYLYTHLRATDLTIAPRKTICFICTFTGDRFVITRGKTIYFICAFTGDRFSDHTRKNYIFIYAHLRATDLAIAQKKTYRYMCIPAQISLNASLAEKLHVVFIYLTFFKQKTKKKSLR